MKEKQYSQAADCLPGFLEQNGDRWTHWINKFIQKKAVKHIIKLIPGHAAPVEEQKERSQDNPFLQGGPQLSGLKQEKVPYKNPTAVIHNPIRKKVDIKLYQKVFDHLLE